jgi:hypothetical protein
MTGVVDPGPEPLPLLQIRDRLRRVSALSLVMLLVFGVFAGFYTSQQNGQRLDDALRQLTESDKQRAASDADRKKLLILVNAQNNAIAALQEQLRQLGVVPVVPGAPTTPASPGPTPPGPAPSGGPATPRGGSDGNHSGTGGGAGSRADPRPRPGHRPAVHADQRLRDPVAGGQTAAATTPRVRKRSGSTSGP